jgi:hypothetical protein
MELVGGWMDGWMVGCGVVMGSIQPVEKLLQNSTCFHFNRKIFGSRVSAMFDYFSLSRQCGRLVLLTTSYSPDCFYPHPPRPALSAEENSDTTGGDVWFFDLLTGLWQVPGKFQGVRLWHKLTLFCFRLGFVSERDISISMMSVFVFLFFCDLVSLSTAFIAQLAHHRSHTASA